MPRNGPVRTIDALDRLTEMRQPTDLATRYGYDPLCRPESESV